MIGVTVAYSDGTPSAAHATQSDAYADGAWPCLVTAYNCNVKTVTRIQLIHLQPKARGRWLVWPSMETSTR